MSTSPYSKDLRTRVIMYLEKGNSQIAASRLFTIHKNTVNRWWKRYQEEGDVSSRIREGFKSKVDKKSLEKYILSNPDAKLYEVGKIYKITGPQVGRILSKLGFSYKKKRLPMWKQVKKSELPMQKQ